MMIASSEYNMQAGALRLRHRGVKKFHRRRVAADLRSTKRIWPKATSHNCLAKIDSWWGAHLIGGTVSAKAGPVTELFWFHTGQQKKSVAKELRLWTSNARFFIFQETENVLSWCWNCASSCHPTRHPVDVDVSSMGTVRTYLTVVPVPVHRLSHAACTYIRTYERRHDSTQSFLPSFFPSHCPHGTQRGRKIQPDRKIFLQKWSTSNSSSFHHELESCYKCYSLHGPSYSPILSDVRCCLPRRASCQSSDRPVKETCDCKDDEQTLSPCCGQILLVIL